MLDIAIVGGGLCGLALADKLAAQAADFALFDARDRLGGRILSVPCPISAMAVDLGPTWFWPATQPLIDRLVQDLALPRFAQPDDGSVLVLAAPDQAPRRHRNQSVHNGAQRLAGGMAGLVQRLAGRLPAARLHTGHTLLAVTDRGDHLALTFRCRRNPAEPAHGDQTEVTLAARRVVLALPPRLIEEHIYFAPRLDDDLAEALLITPTWMAAQAKAVLCYGAMAGFRDRCGAGNAFVTHSQAVLGEIFDASAAPRPADGPEPPPAALGGFMALPPSARQRFRAGLPLLIANQFAQMFGPGFETGALLYNDWAEDPLTCASQDRRADPVAGHVTSGDPRLRRSHWHGRLLLSGSETAGWAAGYLEGALHAAGETLARLGAAPPHPPRTAPLTAP